MIMSFDDRLPVIKQEIAKRKTKWTLSTLDWDDVVQKIMIKVWKNYDSYDPAKSNFTHWLNTVISNEIKNCLRDNLTIYSRPCILGCSYNLGDDNCGYTATGKQCSQCPLYKKWVDKKQDHFNVKQSLPLENHVQEVNSMPNDSMDIAAAKDVIDLHMKEKLKPYEWEIYKLLFIEHKTPEEVGKILKYKACKNSKVPGYQVLAKQKKRFVEIAKQIIREEGLC